MLNFFTKRLNRKNKKGFTLVELIVVIAIVAVLAAVGIPAITGYIGKARVSTANSTAKTIASVAQAAITQSAAADTLGDDVKATSGDIGTVFSSAVASKIRSDANVGTSAVIEFELTEITEGTAIVGYSVDKVTYKANTNSVEGVFQKAS